MQCATHRNLGWRIRVVDAAPGGGKGVVVGGTDSINPFGLGESSSLPAATVLPLPALLLLALLALTTAAL